MHALKVTTKGKHGMGFKAIQSNQSAERADDRARLGGIAAPTESNATHASTTDPDARLYRKSKGQEAKLSFIGHLLMENRNGLIVDARLTQANGTAEIEAALDMLSELPGSGRITVGADKAYDTGGFVAAARDINLTPHVAQNINEQRGSNIDARTTRHAGYRISQVIRKRIEEANSWVKEVAGMNRAPFRGLPRMGWTFQFKAAAYDLVRLPRLLATG
jgi:Transposase DDE domain